MQSMELETLLRSTQSSWQSSMPPDRGDIDNILNMNHEMGKGFT